MTSEEQAAAFDALRIHMISLLEDGTEMLAVQTRRDPIEDWRALAVYAQRLHILARAAIVLAGGEEA